MSETITGYIEAEIQSDPQALAQDALTSLMSLIPGWTPREGNLEVLLLEEFANMAAEAAMAASSVPASIFKYYGGLIGVTQNTGTQAQIYTTWTLVSNVSGSNYTIPAGTIAGFLYQGNFYQYQVVNNTTIAVGNNQATNVLMRATEAGSVYNVSGLSGINPFQTYLTPTTSNPVLSSIVITAVPTISNGLTFGTDAESDSAYLNRLAYEISLAAPRPVTPDDYSKMAVNVPPTDRALTTDGINPYTNLLSANDANLTTATTNNYTAVGNGTLAGSIPTLALTGNALVVTTSSSALTGTTLNGAVAAGATSITAAAAVLDTSVNTTPAFVLINDTNTITATTTNNSTTVTVASTTGIVAGMFFYGPGIPAGTTVTSISGSTAFVISNAATSATASGTFRYGGGIEIVQVTAVSGTSWTLSTKLQYAHANGVTLTPLQGVKVPTATTNLSNCEWMQSAATVQCGTDTTGTATPYVVSVVSYNDGTTALFSSANYVDGAAYDYTTLYKTVICNINAQGLSQLAASNTSGYNTIAGEVSSVTSYVLFRTTATSKTHKITYTSLNQTPFDFSNNGLEGQFNKSSDFNYLPDGELYSYLYTSGSGAYVGAGASWTLSAGLTPIPGYGVQYIGTGSAIAGSALTAKSQIFNVSNFAGTAFTAYVTVDASYAGATYGNISMTVYKADGTSLGSASCTSAGINTLIVPVTIPNTAGVSSMDIYMQLTCGIGLNVPTVSSVVFSDPGFVIGTYTAAGLTTLNPPDSYSWTAGGYSAQNVFNYGRTVSVCPVDSSGLALSHINKSSVLSYLSSRREANFNVYVISPNYVPINVVWSAIAATGYDPNQVQAAGNTAIYNLLNPANWGGGLLTPPSWDPSQTSVRILDIAGALATVPGVATITGITMHAGATFNSGSLSTADISMGGLAPLPVANVVSGNVSSNPLSTTLGGV